MVKSVEYLVNDKRITAYVTVSETTTATAGLNSGIYTETGNKREPFDYNLHTFDFDKEELMSAGEFKIKLKPKNYWPGSEIKKPEECCFTIKFNPSDIISASDAVYRSVRNLKFSNTESSGCMPGLKWTRELYMTEDNKPVRVYTAIADLEKTEIIAGTPHAEQVFIPKNIQSVAEEAEAAESKGSKVLCAVNADFFDIFGDCHPSGICISQGITVANPDSDNAFFGIKKDGTPVITHTGSICLEEIREAVSGREIIVKDGLPAETSPLEPFGDTPYPRTAIGITEDNKVILMVVDGNNPPWSNGASLTELALLMIEKGAYTALNADGGGSSTFVVRENDIISMKNNPCGRIIIAKTGRQVFNSLIVTAGKKN